LSALPKITRKGAEDSVSAIGPQEHLSDNMLSEMEVSGVGFQASEFGTLDASNENLK